MGRNLTQKRCEANSLAEAFINRKAQSWKFAALTVYDYPMGRLLDGLGLDFLLVGDSLGMVVLGIQIPPKSPWAIWSIIHAPWLAECVKRP